MPVNGRLHIKKKGKMRRSLLLCRMRMWKFLRMYVWKLGFLDGGAGFLLCVLSSYYVFLKYACLWGLQQRVPEESNEA